MIWPPTASIRGSVTMYINCSLQQGIDHYHSVGIDHYHSVGSKTHQSPIHVEKNSNATIIC